MRYFEDIEVGATFMTGSHVFGTAEMISFASRYDPQPFHVDEAEAARSHFGGLIASGWHTASVWMRLAIDYRRAQEEAMRSRGEPIAQSGPALGLHELKWFKPVYAGDVIDYKTEVTGLRASASRPRFGLMTLLTTGVNQTGTPVIAFGSTAFIERRPERP